MLEFETFLTCLNCGNIYKQNKGKKKATDPIKCPSCSSALFTINKLKWKK